MRPFGNYPSQQGSTDEMDGCWQPVLHYRNHFPKNSLRKRFDEGVTWVFFMGSIFLKRANFMTSILHARIMGGTVFGKLAII